MEQEIILKGEFSSPDSVREMIETVEAANGRNVMLGADLEDGDFAVDELGSLYLSKKQFELYKTLVNDELKTMRKGIV